MSFTCSSLFHLLVLCLITFYVLLHISFLILYLYHVSFHVLATRPCSYMCISYIYAYSYNFYDLSSLHAYCMSISFSTFSISLAYLLSILLLYSCFYTLHILCKFPILSCSFPFMFIYCACIIYFHISYTFI